MIHERRKQREAELRAMMKDPVGRIVLERKFFETTKAMPPQNDQDFLEAILTSEFSDAAL